MRSMKEINDIGVRALVDALGKEDALKFLRQFRAAAADKPDADEPAPELPSMTIDEAHNTIRDMHDPIEQQHLL